MTLNNSAVALAYNVMNYDVEIFPNFSMIGFRDYQTGEIFKFSNSAGIGDSFDALRHWFVKNRTNFIFVGFNNLAYDNMIARTIIVDGVDDAAALFELSKRTVATKRVYVPSISDEISVDLLAINGGALAKLGSLKECGIKLGFRRLQELPYAYDQVLTVQEMQEVAAYNELDLEITAGVTANQAAVIDGRLAIFAETGTDAPIYNKHDAGLAEAVMKARLFGRGRAAYPKATQWFVSGQSIGDGFTFQHPELVALSERIGRWQMRFAVVTSVEDGEVTKSIEGDAFSESVTVDGVGYRIGSGGLHSEDEPGWFEADDDYLLRDFDVKSFYPALILNHRLVPEHLPAVPYLESYRALMEQRLSAVNAGNEALGSGLKVAINAVFGKTKQAYSWLLDPTVQIGITVKGQLTLLTFVDLISRLDGCEVISANTDGITVRMRRDIADEATAEIQALAAKMQFDLKQTDFTRICRRDINNFVALDAKGSIKAKGAYGCDPTDLRKKAVNRIIVEAVQQNLLNDVPVEETIRGCRDICAFINYFKCTRGYKIVDDRGGEYGGIARWYLATSGVHLDKLKIEDNKRTQLVEKNAVVVSDLPSVFPDDVDFDAYIAMAETLVKAIREPEQRCSSTIPHAELSHAQRAVLEAAQTALQPDLERCHAVNLEPLHGLYSAVYRGNKHDSFKSLMIRLWLGHQGRLTLADLEWLGLALDAPVGQFQGPVKRRRLRKLCQWIVHSLSPFPLPRTPDEHLARALVWAQEHVERSKMARKMWHNSVTDSRYVSKTALAKYLKGGDLYSLACAICAASVKHDSIQDATFLGRILDDCMRFGQRIGVTKQEL